MLYGLWRMERPACDAHLWALTGPVCQWWYGSVSKGNLEWLKGTLVLDGWHLVRMATGRADPRTLLPDPAPKLIGEEICPVPVPVGPRTSTGPRLPVGITHQQMNRKIEVENYKIRTSEASNKRKIQTQDIITDRTHKTIS